MSVYLKSALCLLVLMAGTPAFSQHMWQIGDGRTDHWYFMDGDEFDNQRLDTGRWQNAYPWGRSLYCPPETQYYSDGQNFLFNNGVITLEARKEPVRAKTVPYEPEDADLKCNGKPIGMKNLRNFDFSSAMIFSRKKYLYGYYEIRFRCDEGRGLWPAFWLYSGKENYEIDAFEVVGSRNKDIHVDIHCPAGCKNYKTTMGLIKRNWGDYIPTSQNMATGYNVMGIEWQPSYVKWYLNGVGIAYWKGKFGEPQTVIANLALASDDGPFGPGPDNTTRFPAKFEIDYIRMWSKTPVENVAVTSFQGFLDPDAPRPPSLKAGNASMEKRTRPEYNKKALSANLIFATLAVAEGGKWMILITGNPGKDFVISVTGKSGKTIYESRDASIKEHYFLPVVAGEKHLLKIVNNGSEISHQF